jgi:hypothetical protein
MGYGPSAHSRAIIGRGSDQHAAREAIGEAIGEVCDNVTTEFRPPTQP